MKKSELRKELIETRKANLALLERMASVNLERMALSKVLEMMLDNDAPSAETVIVNGPATVVMWDDGTKTVSKLRDGDEWDPLFGIIACIVRKLTRNRGHAVSESEDLIGAIAADIQSEEDLDDLIDYGNFVLDVLETLRESSPLWMPILGDGDHDDEDQPHEMSAEDAVREREMTRQAIRDLVDRGEL